MIRKNILGPNNPHHLPPKWNSASGDQARLEEEQARLAEQFVQGANSGVAGPLYIQGQTIYSYGPHFPIARREGNLILITTRRHPSRTTLGHVVLVKRAAQKAGKEVAFQELAPEATGSAGYSNPDELGYIGPAEIGHLRRAAKRIGARVVWLQSGLVRVIFKSGRILEARRSDDVSKIIRAIESGEVSNPWYYGYKHGGGAEKFFSKKKPTQKSHGNRYAAVTGPFKTPEAMDKMYGFWWQTGPHTIVRGRKVSPIPTARDLGYGQNPITDAQSFISDAYKGKRRLRAMHPTSITIADEYQKNPAGEGPAKLRQFAASVGLHIATWAPGDGVTRYRFFTKPTDYHAGDGIYTALGLKEAWCFVRGYAASKTGAKGNPSADAQSFISDAYKGKRRLRAMHPTSITIADEYQKNPAGEGPAKLRQFAASVGLHIATWAPGDGVTRYRFFTKPTDYHAGDGIYTALGLKEAWCFVRGYAASKTGAKGNPSADAQSFISEKIGTLIREGYPRKQAIAIAYSMARRAGYRVPARPNPLLQTVMLANPISRKWDNLTRRPRHSAFEFAGFKPVRIPFRDGEKIPIERARAWVRKLGDRELMRQFEDAERLQTKANRKPRFVIWRTLPIGSKNKIEMLTAFAHYGDSPETMYIPPKGSKKGRHMYRHEWSEGKQNKRPVPVLAAPSGKAIIKVMGPGQKVGDWMRG